MSSPAPESERRIVDAAADGGALLSVDRRIQHKQENNSYYINIPSAAQKIFDFEGGDDVEVEVRENGVFVGLSENENDVK